MSPDQIAQLQARYLKIREVVQQHAPSAWSEVKDLCSALPGSIDKNAVWRFGRDKPCYSNIKVNIGKRIASDLKLSDDFETYEAIASQSWEITMKREGVKWRSNSNFVITGTQVAEYLNTLQRGGLASYVWRLYAIRKLAIALKNNAGVSALVDQLGSSSQNICLDTTIWAKKFAREVGMGWGYVTANHLLTDLGLSIKPDLHVRRAAVRMGLLTPKVPSSLSSAEIDKLGSKIDEQIVARLIVISRGITPAASREPAAILRELDKTLMEWSYKNLMDTPA